MKQITNANDLMGKKILGVSTSHIGNARLLTLMFDTEFAIIKVRGSDTIVMTEPVDPKAELSIAAPE